MGWGWAGWSQPAIVVTHPEDRCFDANVHCHIDDTYTKESAISVVIVAGELRKSRRNEKISGIVYSSAVDVLDVYYVRECHDKPMLEYYEYHDPKGVCGQSYSDCGPAKKPSACLLRHSDAIRISSLVPPARFTLVNLSPRESGGAAAASAAAAGAAAAPAADLNLHRPPRRFKWRLPAGARQEALKHVAMDSASRHEG